MEDLKKRVDQFNALQLPGQGISMHMGTSYLVNDLWRRISELEADLKLKDRVKELEEMIRKLENIIDVAMKKREKLEVENATCKKAHHASLDLLEESEERMKKLEADLEQTRVQLAGCGVAALGGTKVPAKQGDYGWSASYQDVLDLRLRMEKAEADLRKLMEAVRERRNSISNYRGNEDNQLYAVLDELEAK